MYKNQIKNVRLVLLLIVFASLIIGCGSISVFGQAFVTTIPIGPEAGNGLRPALIDVNPVTNNIYVG